LKTEIEKINKCIENTVPNYVYASEIISSKIKIANFFFEKFLEYVEKKDTEISSIFKDILGNLSESNNYIFDIIDKLFPKITEKTHSLKSQLEISQKENRNLENSITNLEEKLKISNKEKEVQAKEFDEERKSLMEQINKLQNENDEIAKKVLRKTKDLVNESILQKKYKKLIVEMKNHN
jgi:septal ring factor EnvC (AmiA/AmiB activator)